MNPLWIVLAGTLIPFSFTTLGSATVFLFQKPASLSLQRCFLGFASGVMVAASVWSLLIPALEWENNVLPPLIPAVGGFILGGLFLLGMDHLLPHLHPGEVSSPRSSFSRTTLLFFAVTLHNIPEGMAVGLSFALWAQTPGETSSLLAAMALALGMGIQNFPEGAALSLPLRQEGMSRTKAFGYGTLSGVVEPIFGVLMVLCAGFIQPIMPWLLSFAAGAMIYVVVGELIPDAHLGERSVLGTLGAMAGFLLMMSLDVALG